MFGVAVNINVELMLVMGQVFGGLIGTLYFEVGLYFELLLHGGNLLAKGCG